MTKQHQKLVFSVLGSLFILLFGLLQNYGGGTLDENVPPTTDNRPTTTVPEGFVRVLKVVDGDTVHVEVGGVDETVRLLGIDTPESVDPRKDVECFGKEAGEHLKNLLAGKNVKLISDPTQPAVDKYDRWLRVLFSEDDTDINKQMVIDGYAYEYTYDKPPIRQSDYKAAELEAKKSLRGLWSEETCNGLR
jgi:micrococcal nuclease